MTISYDLYFIRIFKVWSMSHHGSVGRVQSKECYIMFTYVLSAIFVFHKKFLCFCHFHLLFRWSTKSPQQNINQSETENGDKKLSVKLCGNRQPIYIFFKNAYPTNKQIANVLHFSLKNHCIIDDFAKCNITWLRTC